MKSPSGRFFIALSLLLSFSAHAIFPEIACVILLKKVKRRYTWSTGKEMEPHLAMTGALLKFARGETLSPEETATLAQHQLTELVEYWKAQPKLKQKMRYYVELFMLNQTKNYDKTRYRKAVAELNRIESTGVLAALFTARHPFFFYYLTILLGSFGGAALYTQPVSQDDADKILKTPLPEDQIEYVFYPKHVGIRIRDQFFDVGPRKVSKLDPAPIRPRVDGVTLVRIQGDSGLAERVLTRIKNYPEGKWRVYNEWNSTCLSNATDLIRDETGLCVPYGIASEPASTEAWLKVMKFMGSAKITQINTIAPDEKLREATGTKTGTSWLFRAVHYKAETTFFFSELALLDYLHDSAEVNFPREKQSK